LSRLVLVISIIGRRAILIEIAGTRLDKPGATSFAPVTPDVHNKVKNQRIWLMLLLLDLFKYFSNRK